MSNELTVQIIRALVQLANSGQYTCDLDGAQKIAALRQAAESHITGLEAADAAPEETENDDTDI